MKRIISLALCFMLVFALCPYAAFAFSNIAWTGTVGDGSWHNAGNWNLNQVPVDGDYVSVPASSVVEYSSGETSVRLNCAGNLTVSGGTLKFASGNSSLTNGKLDGAGDIQITAGGNFLWSGGSIVGSGKIIVDQNANFYATSGISSPLNRYLVNNGSLLIISKESAILKIKKKPGFRIKPKPGFLLLFIYGVFMAFYSDIFR
jgi:hypothetical protein